MAVNRNAFLDAGASVWRDTLNGGITARVTRCSIPPLHLIQKDAAST